MDGHKRLTVKLSTMLQLRENVATGKQEAALSLLEQILDYEERERLRALRSEVYHRRQHAREMGDTKSYSLYDGLLKDCTEAAKAISI